MLLTRKNAKGGRPLKGMPIVEDPRSGRIGLHEGYCDGCNEPIIVPMSEAEAIANLLAPGIVKYKKMISFIKEPKPNIPISVRLAKWLLRKQRNDYHQPEYMKELEREWSG